MKALPPRPEDLARCIDHTLLRADALAAEVEQWCAEARAFGFFSVCVNGSRVLQARHLLEETPVKVSAVVGFPLGATDADTKRFETESAIDNGAGEIDVVLNLGRLKEGDDRYVLRELRDVVEAADERPVKVIVETCLLTREEKIRACRLVLESGAHFVKTSTGWSAGGATVEDVEAAARAGGAGLRRESQRGHPRHRHRPGPDRSRCEPAGHLERRGHRPGDRARTGGARLTRIFHTRAGVLTRRKTLVLGRRDQHSRGSEMIAFLRRLWVFVRPYRFRLTLGLLCGILSGLTNGALVLAIRLVVNLVFAAPGATSFADQIRQLPGPVRAASETLLSLLPELSTPSSKAGLLLAVLSVPAIMLVRVVFGYLNVYLMSWSAVRAVADLRTRLFDHLQNLSLSFFHKARTGELISRITSDTQMLHQTISSSVSTLVKDPVTVAVLLVLMLSQQPRLTLVSLVAVPLCVVPIVVYGRKVRRSVRATQTHSASLASLMHESFTGNRIIKAYNLEGRVLEQFRQTTREYISQVMRTIRAYEMPHQMNEFFGAIGASLVFVYVIFLGQSMSAGDFIQFIGSVFLMYAPIKAMSRLHNQLEQARAASQRVFELLEIQSEITDPPQPVPLRAAGAEIHFDQIDFDYGEKPVLHAINFTVKPGQLVALVGASGSGKTTLTSLLLRFYDPQRGAVRIGGTDIRSVAVQDLRRQVALVAQETILFNDTIRRNIGYGRTGASDAEIEAAARHAHAHDFIMDKPQGYDTVVGEKGMALSGGQRQRLAIARAILKDAPILVLDEATSSLDTESERLVQAALEELMAGRTTLCIAHRLSTIQNADVIIVLDQGRIVETGTHAELVRRGGVYQRLYELQFQPEAPAAATRV